MAITLRQGNLLVAANWTKLYQTFREANFQAYDFETLRKSMIDYLRLYYPEDFNDFIESSEFVALIDIISFLGQSLAFRADLNARENFIDTAERRDSILKLAKLISYTPKRNMTSHGLLKVDSVQTTEPLFDSDGIALANTTIAWNDSANINWLEQMTTVLNAAIVANQRIGRPGNTNSIKNITVDEYAINLAQLEVPAFPFAANVNGQLMGFEVVGATTAKQLYVYETNPKPTGTINFLYQNDNFGNNSNNTGFFLYAKQGTLSSVDLTLTESLPNRVINLNVDNINNTDVWLYSLDSAGAPDVLWAQVPAIVGNNIAYNTISTVTKQIYQVNTRANDQVDLVFGDGTFAAVPQGRFRVYYRVSNAQAYKITPSEIQLVPMTFTYRSRTNRVETLTITASLRYTLANSSARETLENIRRRAPQQYYTQNRIINGEDYNIFPYTQFNNILKVKAVNRTSSGISRYLDINDPTGKYSSTNIFGEDGLLYTAAVDRTLTFEFINTNDIFRIIVDRIDPLLRSKEMLHYYYENFARYTVSDIQWSTLTVFAGQSTGYFSNTVTSNPQSIGGFVGTNEQYIRVGAIVKFVPLPGYYFDRNNIMLLGTPTKPGDKLELFVSVSSVIADGTNQGQGALPNGTGPVILNQGVPQGAIVSEIVPSYANTIDTVLAQTIVTAVTGYTDFALRYDATLQRWQMIASTDINITGAFSENHAGDTSGASLDSSWLLRFTTDGGIYTVLYRNIDFIFESVLDARFFLDKNSRVFDPRTGKTVVDTVKILKINSKSVQLNGLLDTDYILHVYDNIVEPDGFENTTKIKVSYETNNVNNIPTNLDFFNKIVGITQSLVFFRPVIGYDNFITHEPVPTGTIVSSFTTQIEINNNINSYYSGQLFYATSEGIFYELTITANVRTLSVLAGYIVRTGRADLYFQYKHNTPDTRRIDPSPNNLIDMFVVTQQYETDYRLWIEDVTGKIVSPALPNPEELRVEFAAMENFKPVSDTVLFNPVVFKPLFGTKANPALRATFKVVKNATLTISDSEVKARLVLALNTFFALDNWDFGDTFFFSELSTYLHQQLTPIVASIIIVPTDAALVFGDLLQINSAYNEIFVNAATVDNVQIIPAVTAATIGRLV